MSHSPPPRSALADCCAAFASTQPPPLPPTRFWHPAADRILAATRPQLVPLLVALGLVASYVGQALPTPLGMLPLGAFFLLAGGWCSLNFVRCREAHCVVNGLGWDALGIAALAAFALGVDWRDPLWVAFFAVLAGSVVFEFSWVALRGSTAVRRG